MMASGALLEDPGLLVREIAKRYGEPDEQVESRLRALTAYLEGPRPDRVQHLWRYTDPTAFEPQDLSLPADRGVTPGGDRAKLPGVLATKLEKDEVSAVGYSAGDGSLRLEASDEAARSGVSLLDLHQALREGNEVARSMLGTLIPGEVDHRGNGRFEALNLGLWTTGTLIHVPRGVRLEKPIHLWLTAPSSREHGFLATRLLVVLEEGAELTLIDESEGGHADLKISSVLELSAGPASRLRHVAVQRLEKSVNYQVTQRVGVARDANVLTAMASLGSGITKSDFGSVLLGPGANVELFGFLLGEGRQQFDHHTVHDHRAGHTYSNLDFKVVLKDKARSAYTGLIRIADKAAETEAYQENRNLLLNDGAKAESIPELEILTDEVKCSHGATVGTLDPEHLFYLMSRGLSRHDAVRLIVGGFVEPTLSRLPASLRERIGSLVEERTEGL